jgi:hypothetical protein
MRLLTFNFLKKIYDTLAKETFCVFPVRGPYNYILNHTVLNPSCPRRQKYSACTGSRTLKSTGKIREKSKTSHENQH